MLNILIIEDEKPAARRLESLIGQCIPQHNCLAVLDTVAGAVRWLSQYPAPDIIFMDIQLADGISFDIFVQIKIEVPVIFTTAYDEYALKAFKVNSIDYLLKPIEREELQTAIDKYFQYRKEAFFYKQELFEQMLRTLQAKNYKERFLVKTGAQLIQVPVADIAYFHAADRMVFAYCHSGKRHLIDFTLDQLEAMLDPKDFFRISRNAIVHPRAIQRIHQYQNRRLILDLAPLIKEQQIIVSRERVTDFKKWLDR